MPINSLLYPSNVFVSTVYNVANSLRFNSGSSDYLVRTMDSAPTLATKATISYWFKRTKLDAWGGMGGYSASSGTGNNNFQIGFNDANYGYFWQNSPALYFYTSAVNRDSSAWKNVVISIDTTQGTASNRVKYYENGIRTTSFVTETYPSQNDALNITKNGNLFSVGRFTNTSGTQYYYDGYFAEVALVDGLALAPTDFGEFDEDSGIWKPKDVSGLTFGNNGFYLEFKESGTSANSSGLGADTSGNDHHFTVNNLTAVDQSIDTCTNNFATMNPLDNFYGNGTFAEGNLKVTTPSSGSAFNTGTIGVSSGKWFWEVKYVSDSDSGANYSRIGITGRVATASNDALGNSNSMQYASIDGAKGYNGGSNSYGSAYAPGDIIGVALDLDSGTQTITFYKNGSSQGAIDLALINGGTPTGFWFPAVHYDDGSHSGVFEANFGSPSFAISSGNTDGDGYGNFEYAVPSGYFALNTKNLAEYG